MHPGLVFFDFVRAYNTISRTYGPRVCKPLPPDQIKRAFNLTRAIGLQRQYEAGCIS